MISVQKWLFWPRLSFDPLNGTGNTNKPLETHGHMPIPYPGPREYQIWAFQRVFRSLATFFDFSGKFSGQIWPFSVPKSGLSDSRWKFFWHLKRIFCDTLLYLVLKPPNGWKWKKAKTRFFTPFLALVKVNPRPKNPLKGSNLVLSWSWVRYWHMAMCFQRFVGVSCAI